MGNMTSQASIPALPQAQGFTLKQGIKDELAYAFQSSLQSDFWASVSPQMGQIVPQTVVMKEYPQQAFNHFPFIKLSVSLQSAVWTSINANQNSGLERAIAGEGSCLVDIWSLTAPNRDALFDSLTVLLMLRQNTGADLFDEALNDAWVNKGYPRINPDYGKVNLGSDDEGMGLPWMPTKPLYTSSISFDFSFIQSWGGLSEHLDISKVTAKPSLKG